MRSRASGVARLEVVAAPFILNSRLFVHYVHVLWTGNPGRAGAHPYRYSNMNAAVMIIVGTIAANTSPPGETPSLPKHDDRID